jgi:hypothetical protein
LLRLFVISLMFLLTSCVSVSYDYDEKADFSNLRTYDWLPVPQKTRSNVFVINRVKDAVDRQLAGRGLSISRDNPDFLIALHGGREKIDIVEWGYSYGPRGRFYRGAFSIEEYEEGTLILDFVDAESKELIWRSTATGQVDPDITVQEQKEKIEKTIPRMLEDFPPQ